LALPEKIEDRAVSSIQNKIQIIKKSHIGSLKNAKLGD